jgi:hypothetical protein
MKVDERLKPCPFCSARGVIESHELKGKTYSTVGCPSRECFCYVHFQTTACPDEQLQSEINKWNRRE